MVSYVIRKDGSDCVKSCVDYIIIIPKLVYICIVQLSSKHKNIIRRIEHNTESNILTVKSRFEH